MNARDIHDVEYLNFCGLAYNNWDGIKIGTDIKTAMFDIRKKNTNKLICDSRHLFMTYSEDEMNECPLWDKLYDNWVFLYEGNSTKIAKDLYDLEMPDNGFYGVAFLKPSTGDIIMAFRGTNSVRDVLTDGWVGFFDKYSTQLVSASWFYKQCMKVAMDNMWLLDIIDTFIPHFTGHSLGGALAEYCHILYGESGSNSTTWNGLGMGNRLALSTFEDLGDIVSGLLTINGAGSSGINAIFTEVLNKRFKHMYEPSIMKTTRPNSLMVELQEENYDMIKEIAEDIVPQVHSQFTKSKSMFSMIKRDSKVFSNLRYEFGFLTSKVKAQREEEILSSTAPELDDDKAKLIAYEIATAGVDLANYTKNVKQKLEGTLRNFMFKDDWTSALHRRYGVNLDVGNGAWFVDSNNDIDSGSAVKVIQETVKSFGFKKHGLGNFLMYLDNQGDIIPKHIRKSILSNFLRDIIKVNPLRIKEIEKVSDTEFILHTGVSNILERLSDPKSEHVLKRMYLHYGEYIKELKLRKIFTGSKNGSELGAYNNMNFDGLLGYNECINVKLIK